MIGLASSSIPEFVSGVAPGDPVRRHPRLASRSRPSPTALGSSPSSTTCSCPRWRMVIVYFGYIARMTRAGMIKALEADYTRTATMKGLTDAAGDRAPRPAQRAAAHGHRHRRPDRLPVRRPRRRREDLQLPGLGSTIVNAVSAKDLPVLQGACSWSPSSTCSPRSLADLIIAWMNPRARVDCSDATRRERARRPQPARRSSQAQRETPASAPARERWRLLRRRPGFIIGSSSCCSGSSAPSAAAASSPHDPLNDLVSSQPVARGGPLVRHRQLGRDVLSRVMAGARDVLLVAPLAAPVERRRRHMLGLIMGYVRGVARRRCSAGSSRRSWPFPSSSSACCHDHRSGSRRSRS